MLFPEGQRPSISDVDSAVKSDQTIFFEFFQEGHQTQIDIQKNHEDTTKQSLKSEIIRIELLSRGLTYDLIGCLPGRSAQPAGGVYRFGAPTGFPGDNVEALALMAGPHLAGAENSMPVIRTMMELAATLGERLASTAAIRWSPSRSVMGLGYFTKAVRTWLDGGPFPALGLTAFRIEENGALCSEGLAFFTGQEICLDQSLAGDRVSATLIAVRLVNELVGSAPVESALDIAGPAGEAMRLTPSSDGKILHLGNA